ncbi:MAG: pilus assembly PilX N-terminal domain-containing protein [Lachnospiraceae bacterium]|nr:pilus assembly PilX N-terminal domain-containing protein [Lachnospiraceae bacterium]MDE7185389.1 pilus assembly PilX N-terminal domain-containing protein [Lachnospiraceae bacterium]
MKSVILKYKLADNKGSALVSVLVVCTFMTIIATTMLFVAAQNYQMKLTDYQNKQSFYGAEKALDELKAVLVADVEEAYLTAYSDTMQNFLKLSVAGEDVKEYYQNKFVKELTEKWKKRVDSDGDILYAVQGVMSAGGCDPEQVKSVYKVMEYGVYEGTELEEDGHGGTVTMLSDKFALRGVQVKYTVGNYTSFIYTDICLEPPAVDLSARSYTPSVEAAKEREIIAFTDCVVYMNWRKADYEENYKIEIGTKK